MAATSAEYQFQHNPTQMVITVIYLINKNLFNSCAISFWDCLSVQESQTEAAATCINKNETTEKKRLLFEFRKG